MMYMLILDVLVTTSPGPDLVTRCFYVSLWEVRVLDLKTVVTRTMNYIVPSKKLGKVSHCRPARAL